MAYTSPSVKHALLVGAQGRLAPVLLDEALEYDREIEECESLVYGSEIERREPPRGHVVLDATRLVITPKFRLAGEKRPISRRENGP